VVVRWSQIDGAYVALVPAMPGAGGDGASAEEAVRAAQDSVWEFIEIKKQHGDPIPPSDVDEPEFSGQTRLRMPKSLHRDLARAAEKEGVSLNSLMVSYLERENARASMRDEARRRMLGTAAAQNTATFGQTIDLAQTAAAGTRRVEFKS
jgi:predicted HicB family RNase H-like nuclease